MKYISDSDRKTIELGQRLGSHLVQGDIIALKGDLGSGKTWFTKGLALGAGVDPGIVITSPSFALVNEYMGRCPFFHLDLYRLEELSDIFNSGLDQYLYEEGIIVIEWADKWPEIIPAQTIEIELFIMDEQSRQIRISGRHPCLEKLLQSLKQEA